jgi:hypothetical protein
MSKFKELNAINVNKMTEKKGNFTYLSWSNAWQEAMKVCPDMTRRVYENEHGWNYHTDGKFAWVKVGITIDGVEHIDYLHVMDGRNKSIKIDTVTADDVTKTIQRSTVKAIALHGLGLYIYAGEGLPDDERASKASTKKELVPIVKNDENWGKVIQYLNANKKLGSKHILDLMERQYIVTDEIRKEIQDLVAS